MTAILTPAPSVSAPRPAYRAWWDSRAEEYLQHLCEYRGRVAGTAVEVAAHEYLIGAMEELGFTVQRLPFDFQGNDPVSATVELATPHGTRRLEAVPLPNSVPLASSSLEVVDLGRGTERDFEAAADLIPGKAVLVQHEFPFSTGHTHRRVKQRMAAERGAVAFLIASNVPDTGVVSGGGGDGLPDDIPAAGISYHGGREIARAAAMGAARITLEVVTEPRTWRGQNLMVEIPGQTDEWVVVSAHLDGHGVSENALDNGSGLAAALDAVRIIADQVSTWRRGVRLMFFSFEEWYFHGSRHYVRSLTPDQADAISIDINLDSVVGHGQLNALTGTSAAVEAFVGRTSRELGLPIIPVRPIMNNSDHASFWEAGIPALRLIAGYEEPVASETRHLLTPADILGKIDATQLRVAVMVTAAMIEQACTGARVGRP